MLTKLSTFSGVSTQGEPLVRVFRKDDSVTKLAGQFMPEVLDWLSAFRGGNAKGCKPGGVPILVNALGGSDYWGQNSNGDYFGWDRLEYDCRSHPYQIDPFTNKAIPPYGHQTFLEAHPFVHHQNKDPNRAFGEVLVSCLNTRMKRVELVVMLDRERAYRHNAGHVIEQIDDGEFPDVSMGCFRAGTPILMGDGATKVIEDVEKGDEVFTHLGKSRVVTDTMVRDHERIFRFKAYGHDEQWVTEEHPLWLARKSDFACRPSSPAINNGRKQKVCSPDSAQTKKGCSGCATTPRPEFDWVPVAEAQEGDYVAAPVPQFPTPKKILTRAEARLVGYYLAEGHLLRSKAGNLRGVQFSTGLNESRNHTDIYEMAIEIGLGENISDYDVADRNGKYISIWGAPELATLCEKLCGSGAREKVLHPELLGQPKEVLLEVLGAYTNGDGGTYKGSVYFSTCSESLAHQLGLVAMLCGLIPAYNTLVHKPNALVSKETVEHQVWIGTDTSWKLDTTWKPTRKSKKLNNKRFFYENGGTTWLLTTIEALEEHGTDEPVFNFSVEGHESYIAGGLAVHNCRVPYDVCRICGHKSRTKDDYCEHVKLHGMGHIYPDGRMVGVENWHPRFFDISFVLVGADKTAKMMAKFAGANIPSVLAGEYLYGPQVVAAHRGSREADMRKVAKTIDFVRSAKSLISVPNSLDVPSAAQQLESLKKNDPDAIVPREVEQEARADREQADPTNGRFGPQDTLIETNAGDPTDNEEDLAKVSSALKKPPHREQYPFAGQRKVCGMTVLVENPSGTWRRGKNWATKMRHDYGEIQGSMGTDGDPVDVYVGPIANPENVYIVHQNHAMGAKKGQYDEDKVMLGFASAAKAKKAYMQHYDSPHFFRSMTEMPLKQFKQMIFRKDSKGEKLAEQMKIASELKLEELFTNYDIADKKVRVWKDTESGSKVERIGPEPQHEKTAAQNKLSDIDKEVGPEDTVGQIVKVLTAREPRIPNGVLDHMAKMPMDQALATPSMMGMVLSPEEFQRLVLGALDARDFADALESQGYVFAPVDEEGSVLDLPLKPSSFSDQLMEYLLPLLEDRSYLSPVLARRVCRAEQQPEVRRSEANPRTDELLSKVSAAYNGYRREMAKVAAAYTTRTVEGNPKLKMAVYQLTDEDVMFRKGASADLTRAGAVMAAIPLMMLYASSRRRALEKGEDQDFLNQLIADHPYLSTAGTAILTNEVMKNDAANRAVQDLVANRIVPAARTLFAGRA